VGIFVADTFVVMCVVDIKHSGGSRWLEYMVVKIDRLVVYEDFYKYITAKFRRTVNIPPHDNEIISLLVVV